MFLDTECQHVEPCTPVPSCFVYRTAALPYHGDDSLEQECAESSFTRKSCNFGCHIFVVFDLECGTLALAYIMFFQDQSPGDIETRRYF